ncbi:hypothetical protein FSARC_4646 [Fusarium sarcochroum]|uniref:Uncharacterized protein n=1 Tax=Fusarium sarcochroum TaxID=1208366 RepID=A0A8H4XBA9_9HYPO|nr:hypothetical protein FSARC_4646 [Fusarium sarcochroum]
MDLYSLPLERPGRQKGIILAMGLLVLFGLARERWSKRWGKTLTILNIDTWLDGFCGEPDGGFNDISGKICWTDEPSLACHDSQLQLYSDHHNTCAIKDPKLQKKHSRPTTLRPSPNPTPYCHLTLVALVNGLNLPRNCAKNQPDAKQRLRLCSAERTNTRSLQQLGRLSR